MFSISKNGISTFNILQECIKFPDINHVLTATGYKTSVNWTNSTLQVNTIDLGIVVRKTGFTVGLAVWL
jgi:hypothetical protein